jgi:PadR family transcriptional regulator PadR
MAPRSERASLGDVGMLVLAALAGGDRHGYAIVAEVRAITDDRVRLGTGTLYGALERLTDAGLVAAAGEEIVDGRLRRYYCLTAQGRRALAAELHEREQVTAAAKLRLDGVS